MLQLAPGLIPPRENLPRLPFKGHTKPGFKYQTLLIEPPVLVPRLEADLRGQGVAFVQKKFASRSDVIASLTQKIVINCTGLGAMKLWGDPKVNPIKGQLAMLPAQPSLQYLYGQDGYMFPRGDHVVIGGTFELGKSDETPNKSVCKDLVKHIQSLFGEAPVKPMKEIHIHHPHQAPIVNPAVPSVCSRAAADVPGFTRRWDRDLHRRPTPAAAVRTATSMKSANTKSSASPYDSCTQRTNTRAHGHSLEKSRCSSSSPSTGSCT